MMQRLKVLTATWSSGGDFSSLLHGWLRLILLCSCDRTNNLCVQLLAR